MDKKIEELLQKLNEEQIKPVLDTDGAVLVIAGAGSGKTRVLTTRIAYLVKEKQVDPMRILAITFTNKAANEMKERLKTLVGDVSSMWACTIHSMCVKILRRDIDKIGFDKDFTIYDENDKEKVLKRILDDLGFEKDKLLKPIKNAISSAKNDCLDPEQFREENIELSIIDKIFAVYTEYQKVLAQSNALDFDDLLFLTYKLFLMRSDIADYYAERFQYVHVDEFQDTNKVQFAIIQRLALKHGNLFVVGDDDQSIYGWRGAKIDNILRFDDIYRGAKIYKLEQNYRSTKKILELANVIIANNTERRPKELWTNNLEGTKIEVFTATDENAEAAYVCLQIKNLMARNPDLNYSDFGVFMRVNAISRAFEQEFTKYAIPYRVYGGFRFFERKEIKDVLSYLKLIANVRDDQSFIRSISTPKRGIGEKSLVELREFASGLGLSMYEAIDFIDGSTISSTTKKKFINYKLLIDSFISYSKYNSVYDLMEYVLQTTSFLDQFAEKTDENNDRLLNIGELKNTALEFQKTNIGSTLTDYLSSVTLSTDTDEITDGNCVTIATIHAVKGLEFPCVFVTGLDEKILPLDREGSVEEMEEERRLMYVAVTRAKERLFLTRATSRYMYGRRDFMVASRFLKEGQKVINPYYVEPKSPQNNSSRPQIRYNDDLGDPSSTHGYSSGYAKTFLQNTINAAKTVSSNAGKYKSGMKVKHAKFGEGVVILVKGEGDNQIIDVAFKGVGVKSLSAKYAPLTIIN